MHSPNLIERQVIELLNNKKYAEASETASSLTASHPLRIVSSGLKMLHVDHLYDQASAKLRRAHKQLGNDPFIVSSLADALNRSGDPQKAIALLRDTLRSLKNHPELEVKLSFLLFDSGELEKAFELLNQSEHRNLKSHINARGFLYFKNERFQDALEAYQQLTLLAPKDPEAFFNLGCSYLRLKQFKRAETALDTSRSLGFKRLPELFSNLGIAIEEQNRPQEAAAYFLECIKLAGVKNVPDDAYHLSLIYLRTGKLKEGFNLYDARFSRSGTRVHNPPPNIPWWDGKTTTGHLLLWSEQGIGDQVLYTRTFSWLRNFFSGSIGCVIEGRLVETFRTHFPSINFIQSTEVGPEKYDFHLPTGSIPRILIENEGEATWLQTNKSNNTSPFSNIKKRTSKKLRIGISWFSSNKELGAKNIDPETFGQILNSIHGDKELTNLQYGADPNDLAVISSVTQLPILRTGAENKRDISGVMDVISNLDLVVSSSNTTVHLSGLSNIPTLLLASKYSGRLWYWEQLSSDSMSLWYPSVAVISQATEGDWKSVIPTVEELINE